MQDIIIRVVTAVIIVAGLIIINFKKKNNDLIINDLFWIFISWGFTLSCYCFLGMVYPIPLTENAYWYILAFWICYMLGKLAYIYIVKKKNYNYNIEKKEENEDFKTKYNFFPLFIVSFIAIVLYVIYFTMLNGQISIGKDRNINTNALATLLLLLSQVSLIIWLYELLYSILNRKRITLYGLGSAVIYNLPGVLISGRDALMIFMVSTFISTIYGLLYLKKRNKIDSKLKKKIIITVVVVIAIVFIYLLFLSSNRYGSSDSSAIDMFEWSSGVKFPQYMNDIYYKFGSLGKLFLNIVFYYSSQFSKFSLVFENYKGPFQYGFFQLHYIARMLPDSFNLGIEPVYKELDVIVNNASLPGLKVFWETAIGYIIYDFGKIGALIFSFIVGFLLERRIRINRHNPDIFKLITQILICTAMFITIEMSPIIDYFYIFPLAWLVILKVYNKRKIKNGKDIKRFPITDNLK